QERPDNKRNHCRDVIGGEEELAKAKGPVEDQRQPQGKNPRWDHRSEDIIEGDLDRVEELGVTQKLPVILQADVTRGAEEIPFVEADPDRPAQREHIEDAEEHDGWRSEDKAVSRLADREPAFAWDHI